MAEFSMNDNQPMALKGVAACNCHGQWEHCVHIQNRLNRTSENTYIVVLNYELDETIYMDITACWFEKSESKGNEVVTFSDRKPNCYITIIPFESLVEALLFMQHLLPNMIIKCPPFNDIKTQCLNKCSCHIQVDPIRYNQYMLDTNGQLSYENPLFETLME